VLGSAEDAALAAAVRDEVRKLARSFPLYPSLRKIAVER
jgi:hypothetical protein